VSPGHVSSDRLGEAARHGGLEYLREAERAHVRECDQCRHLYGGYRLADRLLCGDWREVKLPATTTAVARPNLVAALRDRLSGVDVRTLAPAAAVVAIVALIGAALAVPRLLPVQPSGVRTPVAAASSTTGSSARATLPSSPAGSPTAGPADSAGASPGPTRSGPAGPAVLALTRFSGTPVAWSPDGSHLLVWADGGVLQIRDAGGRITGTTAADEAVWVGSSSVAIAVRATGSSGPSGSPGPSAKPSGTRPPSTQGPAKTAPPSSRPSGGRKSSSPGGSDESNSADQETVYLVDLAAHVTATLSGSYPAWSGLPDAMLLGSGTGLLAIASQGSKGWQFAIWNGSLGATGDGLPIAFSQNGSRLAVLHPSSSSGSNIAGWLEILALPSLTGVASFPRLTVHVGGGSGGSAYGADAAFSPDGRFLLASGTLVNLTSGSALEVGKGGWLPDGTLATASSRGLLRWSGTASSPDKRFPGAGTVALSRRGDLIYMFGDGRLVLLGSTGMLETLSLPGIRAVSHLLISPTGQAIALDGRATDGSSIAAVAQLPSR
jgi:hypothetical protein